MAKAIKTEPSIIQVEYTSHTSCHFHYNGKEYNLVRGVGYELPNCDFVKSLIEQERLKIKK